MASSPAKRAVVLCSGGLDSTVTAAEAQAAGYELYLLSVNYGQRHAVELKRVPEIAAALGAKRHLVVEVDLRAIGGSALTDAVPVPKDRPDKEIGSGIPPTYVPARNTLFLALALGWAEVVHAEAIYFGANVLDYSGYPIAVRSTCARLKPWPSWARKSAWKAGRFAWRRPCSG